MRVLVADDDRMISHLVCALLGGRGWVAAPAFDVGETLAAVEAPDARFDLVVLDLQMPGGDGLETLARVKASPAGGAPVLVLSGSIEPGIDQIVARAGAAAFLAKPFTPHRLLDTLDRMVGSGCEPDAAGRR